MLLLEQLLKYRKYTHWKDLTSCCIYGYLRETDDEYGPAGTLYYVGEGTPSRVIDKNHGVKVPSPANIVIFADGLTKQESKIGESLLVSYYGRINKKTGILENIKPGGEDGWDSSGTTLVRLPDGAVTRVAITDSRFISGELQHPCVNTVPIRDEDGYSYRISKNHPDYVSGKVRHISTGTVIVKLADGRIGRVSKNHPDYVSGKLVSISKGMVTVYDTNGNKVRTSKNDQRIASGELVLPRKDCPHCNKSIGTRAFKRHVDKCKSNPVNLKVD
jgi:hypothetical protein